MELSDFVFLEYGDEIRSFNFHRVAKLIREGDISALSVTERNLLADYLEGKLKRKVGAPQIPKREIARQLFNMSEFLMSYGMMPDEYNAWCEENATAENRKELHKPGKKMSRTRSIEVLAEKINKSFDHVKLRVYEGKEIDEQEKKEFFEEMLRDKKESGDD